MRRPSDQRRQRELPRVAEPNSVRRIHAN
jgi:hypothetical protein